MWLLIDQATSAPAWPCVSHRHGNISLGKELPVLEQASSGSTPVTRKGEKMSNGEIFIISIKKLLHKQTFDFVYFMNHPLIANLTTCQIFTPSNFFRDIAFYLIEKCCSKNILILPIWRTICVQFSPKRYLPWKD